MKKEQVVEAVVKGKITREKGTRGERDERGKRGCEIVKEGKAIEQRRRAIRSK